MKKIICSVSFYFALASAMFLILDGNSVFYKFLGLFIGFWLMSFAKAVGFNAMCEVLGINWLMKKFKNNEVIMDMVNE